MALYLFSYDIAQKDESEYQPLFEAIKALGGSRVLYSQWLVPSGFKGIDEIYDALLTKVSGKDRLLVVEIVQLAAWNETLIENDALIRLLTSNARLE